MIHSIDRLKRSAHKSSILIAGFLFVIACIIMLQFQGIDLTDTGHLLSNAALIIDHPDTVAQSFGIWLSLVIVNVIISIFGDYTGLAINLIIVPIWVIECFLVYKILKPCINRNIIFAAFILSAIFLTGILYNRFNYDHLTGFAFLSSIAILTIPATKSKWHYFAAGLILGISIFLRFSNLAFAGFSLAITIFENKLMRSKSGWLGNSLALSFGIAGGVLLNIGAMAALDQLPLLLTYFKQLPNVVDNPEHHHNFKYLVVHYIRSYSFAGIRLFALCGASLLAGTLAALLPKRSLRITALLLAAGGLIGLGFYTQIFKYMLEVYLLAMFLLVIANIIITKNERFRYISIFAAAFFVCSLLGSNMSRKSVFSIWLTMPIAIHAAIAVFSFTTEAIKKIEKLFIERTMRFTIILIMVYITFFFFTRVVSMAFTEVYRDDPRLELTTKSNLPGLKGLLSSRHRIESLTEVVEICDSLKVKDRKILAYNNIPLLYFLTGALPYLPTSWPDQYPPNVTSALLQQSLDSGESLPLVVRGKHFRYRKRANYSVLSKFVTENGYEEIWSNGEYEVLSPKIRQEQ